MTTMELQEYIARRVEQEYHDLDTPCTPTTIKILSEVFKLELPKELVELSFALSGISKHGAQCGLVEGVLVMIGLIGHRQGLDKEVLAEICSDFLKQYDQKHGSLRCKELRLGGFNDDDPPNLCEGLTATSITDAALFLSERFNIPHLHR